MGPLHGGPGLLHPELPTSGVRLTAVLWQRRVPDWTEAPSEKTLGCRPEGQKVPRPPTEFGNHVPRWGFPLNKLSSPLLKLCLMDFQRRDSGSSILLRAWSRLTLCLSFSFDSEARGGALAAGAASVAAWALDGVGRVPIATGAEVAGGAAPVIVPQDSHSGADALALSFSRGSEAGRAVSVFGPGLGAGSAATGGSRAGTASDAALDGSGLETGFVANDALGSEAGGLSWTDGGCDAAPAGVVERAPVSGAGFAALAGFCSDAGCRASGAAGAFASAATCIGCRDGW